jgi:integrase
MDSIVWARELVDAPDLAALGTVIHRRLQAYTAAGAPQSERSLTERLAFENQTRHYMARANERDFPFARRFDRFANRWVDFVNLNKTAETELAGLRHRQDYARGRSDAAIAAAQGWMPAPAPTALPVPPASVVANAPPMAPVGLSDAIHQTIDAIIESKFGKHIAGLGQSAAAPAGAGHTAAPLAPGIKMSEALIRYLAPPRKKLRHKAKGRADTAGIVRFAIAFLDDPILSSVTKDDWDRLDEAMTDIPHAKGVPDSHRSLFDRYSYAQQHGWAELSRVSITTVNNRYHYGMNKFIGWAIEENLYSGKRPKFECVDENNLAPLPRDAFDDRELIELISLALFTGCAGINRAWVRGKYFVQSHIYWGFLILILTGMRPGEVGQLKCADLVTDGENVFFDLRPFDARKGRVAMKDLRNLKTNAAGRVVPIHPLLIELGLIDRLNELMAIGEQRLFPEWEKYTRRDGTVRWSQPITKAWQYLKKLLKTRADLTLYSTRHLMADWLDAAGIAQRTRDRILGHVSGVPGRYGKKGMFSPAQVAAIEALEPPVVKAMRTILMAAKAKADRGELVVLKPWLTKSPA